jgi:cation transporter-like permease
VGLRLKLPIVSRILRESVPVCWWPVVDLVAGSPSSTSSSPSSPTRPCSCWCPVPRGHRRLGSVLSSRLASKLHLGIIHRWRRPSARDDFAIVPAGRPGLTLVASRRRSRRPFGLASPGVLNMIGISLIGGAIATFFALFIALRQHRHLPPRPRPRQLRRPLLTSSMDLIGAWR